MPDLQWSEAVHMDPRNRFLDGREDIHVELPRELRVDAPLQADFGGPARRRLGSPLHDLLDAHQVRVSPEVQAPGAFREGTEAAPEVADVRVVDVAVDHIGNGVPDPFLP